MNFLCLGYGSIGKRHTRILREMGHNVTMAHTRADIVALIDAAGEWDGRPD